MGVELQTIHGHELEVVYEPGNEVLVINGVRYATALFGAMAFVPVGTWLRIEGRRFDLVHVYQPPPTVARTFDAIVGRGGENLAGGQHA